MKKILSVVVFCTFLSFFYLTASNKLLLGADRLDLLLPELKNKQVALIVNHTRNLSNGQHLLDALLNNNINVIKVFAPEHGFRENADAGEKVIDEKDTETALSSYKTKRRKYLLYTDN